MRRHFAATVIFSWALAAPAIQLRAQTPGVISGELRMRAQARDNADFNADRPDGTLFVLNRVRLGFGKALSSRSRVFIQLQDSRIWGEEGGTLTALNHVDLHQGWIEIDGLAGLPLTARVGRQPLQFGNGRLVGRYDWHNTARALDAGQLTFRKDSTSVHAWVAQVRDLNAPAVSRNQEFAGIYLSHRGRQTLEAYGLFFFDGRNYDSLSDLAVPIERSDEGSNHLLMWTVGSRLLWQPVERLTLEAEAAWQFGNRGPQDIRARGMALEASYSLSGRWHPRFVAGWTYGSGDDRPGDEKVETFANLFPDSHRFLGLLDYASWSNINSWHAGLDLQPTRKVAARLRYHALALATDRDNWYKAQGYLIGAPAEVYRQPVPGAGTTLGSEIDVALQIQTETLLSIEGGGGLFLKGDFIRNTGGARSDHSFFAYVSLAASF